ncbi:MAG: restriction endonuclease subunit S [Anaerolineales bacterium]|nr:restriction endonuclease subunit S [Anaerolineales bacterium]
MSEPLLNELPMGWVLTNIETITRDIDRIQPADYPHTEFVYLDISSIDNRTNKIIEPKRYLGSDAPSRARQIVQTSDILLSTVRVYLQNIAIVSESYDGQIASTGFSILRTKDGIDPKYLFYYCLLADSVSRLEKLQRGTSYPAVRDSDVKAQIIPLAPTGEQQRIVDAIETLFTRLDAGVEILKRLQANLKRYRASVLKAACEGKLVPQDPDDEPASELLERILVERRARWEAEQLATFEAQGKKPPKGWQDRYPEPQSIDVDDLPELPEGWKYTRIDVLLSIARSGIKTGPFGSLLKKHEHQTEGVPVFGIENIARMKFVAGNKIFITDQKARELQAYSVQEGDVIISRSGTVGEACVIPMDIGEARISTNLIRIVLNSNAILPDYFTLLFNGSIFLLNQIDELCSGSTRDFLNQAILKSLVFPLPPINEQVRITDVVDKHLSIMEIQEKLIDVALARVHQLRQSILREAFMGKLVPQDPNDESASELLERIRGNR